MSTRSRFRAGGLAPALFLSVLLAACASPDFLADPDVLADRIAARHGWQGATYSVGPFQLRAYEGFTPGAAAHLTAYVESDGHAWETRTSPSADPSPVKPVMLRMAVGDRTAGARVYLARPCQYLARNELQTCSPIYWTGARFSEEVIASMSDAIDIAKRRSGAQSITLVGYSGGGAIVMLVAARRHDVRRIITVSGTLDHAAWTRQLGTSPLRRSLNPADFTAATQSIPQLHFVGMKDKMVPPEVLDAYLSQVKDRSEITVIRKPDFDHDCCWADAWPALMGR